MTRLWNTYWTKRQLCS